VCEFAINIMQLFLTIVETDKTKYMDFKVVEYYSTKQNTLALIIEYDYTT